jgi:arylformamidase
MLFGEGIVADLRGEVGDFDIITPRMVEDKVDVREGDILILNTGRHRFHWMAEKKNEEKYFVRHPAPHVEFARWAIKKKLKWLGADSPALDHPLDTAILATPRSPPG